MCLTSADFALEWDSNIKEYVGKGYKKLNRDYPYFDEWQEAKGWHSNMYDVNKNGIETENTLEGKIDCYHAGFHIFLSEVHASQYDSSRDFEGETTYEVSYCDVLAFGKNETDFEINGKTVIARYMYVHSTPLRNEDGKLEYNLEGESCA